MNLPRLQQIAAIFGVDMWDLLQSGKNGLVLQINEGDSGGDISLNAASADVSTEIAILKLKLQHCQELLQQKEREIELLRRLNQTGAAQADNV